MSQSLSSDPPISLPVLPQRSFGQTNRKDNWWWFPLLTFCVFGCFIVYATWAAFQGRYYHSRQRRRLLSPFYSPETLAIRDQPGLVAKPGWWPGLIPLVAGSAYPVGARRISVYLLLLSRGVLQGILGDPLNCAVGEPRKSYWGENSLPLILQNVHRYFFYLAVLFLFLLAWDVFKAMWFIDPVTLKKHFGIGLGTIVLAVNVYLLGSYSFGCHSLRHLIGGRKDEVSKGGKSCQKAYDCVSCLNGRHGLWAWCSLFSVGFADLYVRLCTWASGTIGESSKWPSISLNSMTCW